MAGWLAMNIQTLLVPMILSAGQQKGHPSSWRRLPLRRGRSSRKVRAGSKAGVLACWIRGNKHLMIGAPVSHVRSVRYMSEVRMNRRPTEVHETALYWAGVVSVRSGAIAEKKVSQHFCVWVSVCVRQPVH